MTRNYPGTTFIILTTLCLFTWLAACAPAAPPGQAEPTVPICDASNWKTEAEGGCIRPTRIFSTPQGPPEHILRTIEAIERNPRAAPPRSPTRAPTLTPTTQERVNEAIQRHPFDAIVRTRATSKRVVNISPLTEDLLIRTLTRTSLEVIEQYQGQVPEHTAILMLKELPDNSLDVGGEYVMFLRKTFYHENNPEYQGQPERLGLDQRRLDQVGGEAYMYLEPYLWAIDGTTAYHVPFKHLHGGSQLSNNPRRTSRLHEPTETASLSPN